MPSSHKNILTNQKKKRSIKVDISRPFSRKITWLTPFSIFFLKLDIKEVLVNTKENMSLIVAKKSGASFKSGQMAQKKKKFALKRFFFNDFFIIRERKKHIKNAIEP